MGSHRSREEFSLTIPAERYGKVYRAILYGNPLPKFEAKAENGKRITLNESKSESES